MSRKYYDRNYAKYAMAKNAIQTNCAEKMNQYFVKLMAERFILKRLHLYLG